MRIDRTSYAPPIPRDAARFGIAFIGCGSVVRRWQLPQYLQAGFRVVGLWDRSPEALTEAARSHPALRTYPSLEALLDDPEVAVVDIATYVTGRAELICRALAAGKHVLAQKPICRDRAELEEIRRAAAAAPACHCAINFNGRWAPPWRAATGLIRNGVIGEIVAITHIHDIAMSWLPDPERHGSSLFLLSDYMIHWLDISLEWLGPRARYRVWAHLTERRGAAFEGETTQVGWLSLVGDDEACVSIRSVAAARTYSGHPFIVHGTRGELRGAVDAPVGGEYLELENEDGRMRFALEGGWFPDGFVGTMGALLTAVSTGAEPEHSFAHAARVQEIMFAACQSAQGGGAPMFVAAADDTGWLRSRSCA